MSADGDRISAEDVGARTQAILGARLALMNGAGSSGRADGASAPGPPIEPAAAPASEVWRPRVRSLADVLEDPAITAPPRWVLPRLVEDGEVALLSAPPKTGKSTFVAQLAAAKSAGRPALDETPLDSGVVLWLGLDESLRRLAPRLQAFGANAQRLFLLEREPGRVLTAVHLAALLGEYRPALVVLDTTSQLALDSRVDANDGAQVGSFLRPLVHAVRTASTREHPCASVFIHHAPHHARRAAGSLQWGAIPDADLVLRRPGRKVDPNAPDPDDDAAGPASGDDGARILEGVTRAEGPLKLRLAYTAGRYVLADRPVPLIDRVRTLLATMHAAGQTGPQRSSNAALRARLGCSSPQLGEVLRTLEDRAEVRREGGAAKSPTAHYVPTGALGLYVARGSRPEEVASPDVRAEGRSGESVRERVTPPPVGTSSRVQGCTPAHGKMYATTDGAPDAPAAVLGSYGSMNPAGSLDWLDTMPGLDGLSDEPL